MAAGPPETQPGPPPQGSLITALRGLLHPGALALLVAGAAAVFLIVLPARHKSYGGDTACTLLTSQALAQHATIRLDAYISRVNADYYGLRRIGDHYYDYSPLGTALFSAPVVLAANLLGMDMLKEDDFKATYRLMTAIEGALIFALLFLVSRCYAGPLASLAISLCIHLGTMLMGTLGATLASNGFAVVFTTGAILMMALRETGRTAGYHPYLMGALLFCAYISRPTASLFILGTFIYLGIMDRGALLRAAASSFLLLMAFVAFSYRHYQGHLPPYYLLKPVGGDFLTGLVGITLSPSKGIFVFSPMLIAVLLGAIILIRRIRPRALAILCLAWPVAHILTISNWMGWDGAYGYGPRLLTDSMAAYALLAASLWQEISHATVQRLPSKRVAGFAFLALSVPAIWINTYQGLYNPWTAKWSLHPPLEQTGPEIYFDWRIPHFMASPELVLRKARLYYPPDHIVRLTEDGSDLVVVRPDAADPIGVHLVMGQYHMGRGEHEAAARELEAFVSVIRGHAPAHYALGQAYMHLGLAADAAREFTEAIEADTPDAGTLFMRGAARYLSGAYEGAREDLRDALAQDGSLYPAALIGALADRRLGGSGGGSPIPPAGGNGPATLASVLASHIGGGTPEQALADYLRQSKDPAVIAEGYFYIAEMRAIGGDPGGARTAYEACAAGAPDGQPDSQPDSQPDGQIEGAFCRAALRALAAR